MLDVSDPLRPRTAGRLRLPASVLGLAVVDRIVKAHGGSVSVQSEEGKGTTFSVDLPAV